MTVAVPSTPASYFHLLRWQVLSRLTRPLVIFTPKSLLRAKQAVSTREDFTNGVFQPLLTDPTHTGPQITKVLLCSGKVYYDLAAYRDAHGITDTAIMRMERLYPLPMRITEILDTYPGAQIRWVQEEPANQGAWSFIAMNLPGAIGRPVECVSRPASSSPAVGTHQRHEVEQNLVIEQAFA
jgi:2-oxoglutarate dehydrogenase E1 component